MLVRQQQELLAYLCVLQADATRVSGTLGNESAHCSMLQQLLVGELEERLEPFMIDAGQLEGLWHSGTPL
jgi:hypothetical protein